LVKKRISSQKVSGWLNARRGGLWGGRGECRRSSRKKKPLLRKSTRALGANGKGGEGEETRCESEGGRRALIRPKGEREKTLSLSGVTGGKRDNNNVGVERITTRINGGCRRNWDRIFEQRKINLLKTSQSAVWKKPFLTPWEAKKRGEKRREDSIRRRHKKGASPPSFLTTRGKRHSTGKGGGFFGFLKTAVRVSNH